MRNATPRRAGAYEPGADEGPSVTYPQSWKRLPSPAPAPLPAPAPAPLPAPPPSRASADLDHAREQREAMRRCIRILFVVFTVALACALGIAFR